MFSSFLFINDLHKIRVLWIGQQDFKASRNNNKVLSKQDVRK